MKILIRGGRVIDPASGFDHVADVCVAAGKVVSIGREPADFAAQRVIEASGLVVAPGLVDLAARLREPGLEHKATLESEMHAAAAGGVTALACPPDTDPPLDEPGLVEMLKFRARNLPGPRVYPVGALTTGLLGAGITEMSELTEAGCVAFSQADAVLTDTQVLMRAMQYAATFGYSLWLRPQDPHLSRNGIAHEGAMASTLGLVGIPVVAETLAIGAILQLMRATAARVHLCRLSSAAGLELVRAGKAEGLPLTCDVAAHHLHLTDAELARFDAQSHVIPPLRSEADRLALAQGLADGSVDAVCSDHAPHDDEAKEVPFGESEPGASGVELLLPLTLAWAAAADVGLPAALAAVTSRPAAVLGLGLGRLVEGAPADLCIFDAQARWTVTRESMRSQGRNSPFLGRELRGRPRYTVIDGHIDFEAPTAG
ncbi:MAG: dihydroorotase [Burkholderiales bacterium]|nr:dihydroorotase [Burkholderiales bacterium]